MERYTQLNPGEGPAPHTETPTAGAAISSVARDSHNFISSSSSHRSSRNAPPRNKNFSQGATRSREHPPRPLTLATLNRPGTQTGYQPHAQSAATQRTSFVGSGPRPPTTPHIGGAPHPSQNPVNPTLQSHTGPPRRVDRCTPARPVPAPRRNSLPLGAMGRPPW